MNAVMITNAQFYFALSVPLVGILVNAALVLMLNQRVSRLEDRMHTGFDLLVGKINEMDVRLARVEERLSR